MLNLIARFWDVSSGSIEIGDVNVRTMKCDRVMQNISVIFQKAYLFHDTIEANICFGNPNATRAQVVDAAQKTHQIIVLGGDGSIREIGRHNDLMAKGGLYTDLWKKSQKISSWAIG